MKVVIGAIDIVGGIIGIVCLATIVSCIFVALWKGFSTGSK